MKRSSNDKVGKYHDILVIRELHDCRFSNELKREMVSMYVQNRDLQETFQWAKEKLRKEDAEKVKEKVVEEQKRQKELEQNENGF